MVLLVIGGTGLIGSALVKHLQSTHTIIIATRRDIIHKISDTVEYVKLDFSAAASLLPVLRRCNAVINLAGANIARLWTNAYKRKLVSSRINTTRMIVDAIDGLDKKPFVFINASAVGYYGNIDEDDVTEEHPKGKGFLADTCELWEQEALRVEKSGVRVVLLRTGIVLSNDGGMFPSLLRSVQYFAGSYFGNGKQWLPWIHIEDEIHIINYALTQSSIGGAINCVAPQLVQMKEFTMLLAKLLHRPVWGGIPSWILRAVLGQMADELLLSGQRAIPQKLLQNGYCFRYESLEMALQSLLRQRSGTR